MKFLSAHSGEMKNWLRGGKFADLFKFLQVEVLYCVARGERRGVIGTFFFSAMLFTSLKQVSMSFSLPPGGNNAVFSFKTTTLALFLCASSFNIMNLIKGPLVKRRVLSCLNFLFSSHLNVTFAVNNAE